jgi:transcriptional regulator with XRE-family HTH domain
MPTQKRANSADVIVGANLRRIRVARQTSQQALAASLGVTFQQLQKYERGTNRISAGRLVQLSRALDCSLDDFFTGTDSEASGRIATAPLSASAHRLAALFDRIGSPVTKRKIMGLVAAIVGEDDAAVEAEA